MANPVDEVLWERLFRALGGVKAEIRESFAGACTFGPIQLVEAASRADRALRDFYLSHVYEMESHCGVGLLEEFWETIRFRERAYRDALRRCPDPDAVPFDPAMTLEEAGDIELAVVESIEAGRLGVARDLLRHLGGVMALSRRIDALRERYFDAENEAIYRSHTEPAT